MPRLDCHKPCWIAAGTLGVIVWVCAGLGAGSVFAGLLLGLVTMALLGRLLIWGLCEGRGGQIEDDDFDFDLPRAAADPNPVIARDQSDRRDDLQQIKGIGPKLEQMLHEHGVYHYDMIALWNDADINRYAEIIGHMGGRIRNDDWVGQARILAQGGQVDAATPSGIAT